MVQGNYCIRWQILLFSYLSTLFYIFNISLDIYWWCNIFPAVPLILSIPSSPLSSLMSIYLSMIMVLYSMGINTTHTSIYFQSTPMSRSSSIAISSIHCISQKHFHVFTQKATEKEEQSVHKREYAIIEWLYPNDGTPE